MTRAALALLPTLAAAFGALWLGGWRPGPFPVWSDLLSYFLPKYEFAAARLAEGALPLWNPFEFCGIPFLATIQPGVFYPPLRVMYAFLGGGAAHALFFWLHVVLAAFLTLALLRALGCGLWASVLAAAWVAQPSWVVRVYDHPVYIAGVTWIPLLVLLARRSVERPSMRGAGLLGMVAATQIVSGYPFFPLATAYLLALGLPFWLVEIRPRVDARRAVWIGLALGLGLGSAALLAAAQLVPTAELAALTERSTGASLIHEQLVDLGHRTPVVVYAAGVPAATFGQALGRVWREYGPALLALGLAALVLRPRSPAVWYVAAATALSALVPLPLLYRLPLYGLVRFALEWTFVAPLFVYALAGLGLDAVRRRVRMPAPWQAAVVLGVLAATTAWDLHGVERAWLAPSPWPDPVLPAAVEQACDLGPGRSRIFWPQGHWNGAVIRQRVESIAGYEQSLLPSRTAALMRALGLGAPPIMGNWAEGLARHPDLLSRMGVRCVVNVRPAPMREAGFVPVPDLGAGFDVLRSDGALPRARMVFAAHPVAGPDEALRALLDGVVDAREAVILEGDPGPAPPPCAHRDEAIVQVTSYRPEEVRLRVSTSCAGYVVLSDSFAPGWLASVDGNRAPVLVADYAFRAVLVPAGPHEVVFRYEPRSVRLGMRLSLAGLVLVTVLLVLPAAHDPLGRA